MVDVMEMLLPPRAAELAARLQRAIRQNPEWVLAQVQSAKPGEPLPYDARLGVTKEEYDEFLALSQQRTMQKKRNAKITITMQADDVYALDGGDALPDLNGIVIDLKNDLVRTPFGIAKERSEINTTDKSPLGSWRGIQWALDDVAPDGIDAIFAKLAIGRQTRTGRGIIYYDVKIRSSEGKNRISHVLTFDLP